MIACAITRSLLTPYNSIIVLYQALDVLPLVQDTELGYVMEYYDIRSAHISN